MHRLFFTDTLFSIVYYLNTFYVYVIRYRDSFLRRIEILLYYNSSKHVTPLSDSIELNNILLGF